MISFGIRASRTGGGALAVALLLLSFPLSPEASSKAAPTRGASVPTAHAPARLRVLFLRVDFPDHPASGSLAKLQNSSRSGLVDRLVDYYDEVSSRRFHIDASVSKRVYTLPRRRAEYSGKTADLVADALARASAPGSKGERDWIARLRPGGVVVFFAGPGAESEPPNAPSDSPWSASTRERRFDAAGVALDGGVVVAEDPAPPFSSFGVLAHEFGHLLGLPELYAPGRPHEGIGVWGLMGQGTWLGHGDEPPHPCAWSKLHLGWVDAIEIDGDRHVELPAIERSALTVKILAKGPEAPHEYFLIENRRRWGADRSLPGEGLLVWHVDESLGSFRRSQDDPAHKRVDLLTADRWPSHLDVGTSRGGNRGDAGDPWAARSQGPGPGTVPSTAAYDGSPGRFSLRNISAVGDVMSFDVVFEPAATDAPRGAAP
jgi:M6 family metalloprotease-like protein